VSVLTICIVRACQGRSIPLGTNPDPPSDVVGYAATSLGHRQYDDEELLKNDPDASWPRGPMEPTHRTTALAALAHTAAI